MAAEPRARCAWVESERDSRISEILIQPVGFRGGLQEMAKPYSQDLRERVIDAAKRGEMSRRAAARRYRSEDQKLTSATSTWRWSSG
jgi:hypothetical protein